MRLFVGCPVPAFPAARLAAELEAVAPRPHVTLRFLGHAEPGPVAAAIQQACRDTAPIECSVVGVGTFGSPTKARVAYAGIEAPGLHPLQQAIEAATRDLGRPPEKRPFVPHVTLARFARPRDVRDWLARHEDEVFASGTIDRVVLYASTLTPGGARHAPVASTLLGSGHPGPEHSWSAEDSP